jgi:subtilase family serine protease
VAGIPAGGFRDLPDVSLSAAGHDAYLICFEGSCQPNSQGQIFLYFVSGTSASAPSFASIMALVNQKTGSRQGQADYVLYQLAAQENFSQCNGSSTLMPPASTCIFNDITIGNNSVPGLTGFNSGVGYDMATGLGSVNVTNLLNAWRAMTFNATTTTLLLNGSTSDINITHGTPVTVNVSVMGNSGTPSGDVSLSTVNGSKVPLCTSPNSCTLSPNGTHTASLSTSTNLLPGGSFYPVTAHYAGDGKFAASDSYAIVVKVDPEPSTTMASIFARDINGLPVTQGPASSAV